MVYGSVRGPPASSWVERTIEVNQGEAAEFSTMTTHAIACDDERVKIFTIFNRDGNRAHLHSALQPSRPY